MAIPYSCEKSIVLQTYEHWFWSSKPGSTMNLCWRATPLLFLRIPLGFTSQKRGWLWGNFPPSVQVLRNSIYSRECFYFFNVHAGTELQWKEAHFLTGCLLKTGSDMNYNHLFICLMCVWQWVRMLKKIVPLKKFRLLHAVMNVKMAVIKIPFNLLKKSQILGWGMGWFQGAPVLKSHNLRKH